MADVLNFNGLVSGAGIQLLNSIGASSPTLGVTFIGVVLTFLAVAPNYVVYTIYDWPTDLLSPKHPSNPCGKKDPACEFTSVHLY